MPPDFIADEARSFLTAVLQQLGIARFVAFGHSVGGGMAIHGAGELGARCEALFTESAQAFVEDRTVQGLLAAREQFRAPSQMQRLTRDHGDKTAWVLQAWLGTWLSPGFAQWSLQAVLPRVKCAVLAMHGAQDEYGLPRHPELIGQLVPGNCRGELMAQAGHVPHRKRPVQLISATRSWLGIRGDPGNRQEGHEPPD